MGNSQATTSSGHAPQIQGGTVRNGTDQISTACLAASKPLLSLTQAESAHGEKKDLKDNEEIIFKRPKLKTKLNAEGVK